MTKQSNKEKLPALTPTMIEKLEPKEKMYDVRDSKITGLYVRVQPTGVKSFRFEYKRGKHYTIGRVGPITLAQAKEKIKIISGETIKGNDPNQTKKRQRIEERQKQNKFTFVEFLEEKYKPWYKTAYPKTWKDTFTVLDTNFKTVFGKLLLEDITLEKVESWRAKQKLEKFRVRIRKNANGEKIKVKEPITPATLNRYVERLSGVLGKAVEYGCIEKNPIAGIKKLKVAEANRIRFLDEKEYATLLKVLDQREEKMRAERDRANEWRVKRRYELYSDLRKQSFADYLKPMVLLSLGSGIRFGTLIRLQWNKHVDMIQEGNITLNLTPDIVKTEKGYQVPLDKKTSEMLLLWFKQNYEQHQGKGWVFPGKKPEQHITSVKKSWNTVLEAAGIENFHWHDQRHDYASQHVMSGTDLYTVMELLGHTDPKMTKKYAHLAAEHKQNAAEKLAERRSRMLKDK